jgi:hypothetical protein
MVLKLFFSLPKMLFGSASHKTFQCTLYADLRRTVCGAHSEKHAWERSGLRVIDGNLKLRIGLPRRSRRGCQIEKPWVPLIAGVSIGNRVSK